MRPEVAKLLFDAHAACLAIASFTGGANFARYSNNALLRSAVERLLEIIGEALGRAVRLDPSLEHRVAEIHRIVGLRNRLIHGYDSVDDQLVWDLVQTKLPGLTALLSHALHAG